jgi:prepilin-type N-terminal cleavage/methylation domain-containing protein/prepilin-type processing-associated H-X9-DG protein
MKRIGFTLLELLVTLGVIALLIAILTPCLQALRQQAKTVLCSSNIRQLTLGLLMYEAENKTLPYAFYNKQSLQPPPEGYSGNISYDRPGWWWFNFISDYVPKSKIERGLRWCPARRVTDSRFAEDVLCGNYGINRSLCKSYQGIRKWAEFNGKNLFCTKDMQDSSKTLLLIDCGYSMLTWWHAADIPPVTFSTNSIEECAPYVPGLKINKERYIWPGLELDALNGRHPGKTVNAGFTDGHISRKKADDFLVENTAEGYKNRCPLWVPE